MSTPLSRSSLSEKSPFAPGRREKLARSLPPLKNLLNLKLKVSENVRHRLGLVFWWIVFLFLFLTPIWLIFSSLHAQAQDAGADDEELDPGEEHASEADADLGLPFEMDNPRTGEPGTWIPRWAEREHLLDANKLAMCLKDSQFFEMEIAAIGERHEELTNYIEGLDDDLKRAEDAVLELEKKNLKAETKLERRIHAVWGLLGGSIALAATTTVVLLVR